MDSHVQVSPEQPSWISVRTLAGPLKNIDRVVPKPLLCYFSCVLGVVVLLEVEPPADSEVVNTVEKGFTQDECTWLHSPFLQLQMSCLAA